MQSLYSATGAYQLLSGTPAGILDRGISSANNYRAPVNINSAVYDSIMPIWSCKLYETITTADTQGFNVRSAIYNPYMAQLGTNMVGNPMAAYTANAANANALARSSADAAAAAGRAVGQSFNSFYNNNISRALDKWAAGKADKAPEGSLEMVWGRLDVWQYKYVPIRDGLE